jgi:hypothetical protein
MAGRTPAEIRSSIEANRAELALSVERATDWRYQLERHRTELTAGAAVVGVLVVGRLLLGRRRRRRGG